MKDLLNPSDRQLKIREHPEMGIYVVRSKSAHSVYQDSVVT